MNKQIKAGATFSGTLAALTLAAGMATAAPATVAPVHAPGIVGIDHVGINVPDLDQAIAFFHDMFGFDAVTRLGPFPLDANWKQTYRVHDGAREVTLAMLRAGDGANIELFAYRPAAGSQQQPWRDDIGATHIALYTTDIDGAKAWLEAKGLKFLSGINAGGGDTEGERWVYFDTPWGASIELNAYPQGKGYEKRGPAVKLWTAPPSGAPAAALSAAELQRIAGLQEAVWNEADSSARLANMRVLYSENIAFRDHDHALAGLGALNERITALQQQNRGFRFSTAKVDASGAMVRFDWHYGPASNPKLVSGSDILVLDNGKVRSLNVFLERAAGK